MLLTNFNIQECVTEQINSYLADDDLSFADYKALVLSKSPIPKVHALIVDILTKEKTANQKEVQKALEKQAYKSQLTEDEKQKKQDQSAILKDETLKEALTRELNHIPTLEVSYGTEKSLLMRRLARLLESVPQAEVIQHHRADTFKLPTRPTISDYELNIRRINKSILEYKTKANTLIEKRKTIQLQLDQIEIRTEKRLANQEKRTKREQARVGYQTTGEGIQETLSSKNRALLNENIREQYSALEKKCVQLIEDSEHIHFASFLEQLTTHLNQTKKISTSEVEALQTVLKLMKQHLVYEQQVVSIEESLSQKNQSISLLISKLKELKQKMGTIKTKNPSLTSDNMQLFTRNLALALSLEQNDSLKQRLGTPALLLFALTLAFTIPLILTINGIIPFFIAPALLYALVVTPPLLLLIATIACGIAALVYSCKAHYNEAEIKENKSTIEDNAKQMGKNHKSLHTLVTTSIPNIEGQIKKDESLRERLETSLKNTQVLSNQTLNKANLIEPISYARSSFLEETSREDKKETADEEVLYDSEESETMGAPS